MAVTCVSCLNSAWAGSWEYNGLEAYQSFIRANLPSEVVVVYAKYPFLKATSSFW